MKKNKGIIAVLLTLVIVCGLVACSSQNDSKNTTEVTQAVTDDSGEVVTEESGEVVTETVTGEVVTDANGETVTEAVTNSNGTAVTQSNGTTVTQAVTQAASSNKTTTTAKSNKNSNSSTTTTAASGKGSTTTTQKATVKKPSAPKDVSSIKVSSITDDSLKVSWSSVKCDGYQLQYKKKGESWTTNKTINTTSKSYTLEKLESMTTYEIRVRAYNKNDAGSTPSAWKQTSADTKEDTSSKYLTISVILPSDGNATDTLTISIDGEVVHTAKVKCNGSTYTYKTEKKYKGVVTVEASLKDEGSSDSAKTDKDVTLDVSDIGIYVINGVDD